MSWGKLRLDKADVAFSQFIRLRDRKCLRCGSPVKFNAKGLPVTHQASHFQGRAKEATRYDEENVCTLCAGCHQYLGAHPAEHYLSQVKRLGQKKVDALVLRSNMYHKKQRAEEALYWREEVKKLCAK